MKKLGWMIGIMLVGCQNDDVLCEDPLYFNYFFRIQDQQGEYLFLNWTDEELSQIRFKSIDVREDEIGKTAWESFGIWRTDTAIIFQTMPCMMSHIFIHFRDLCNDFSLVTVVINLKTTNT